MPSAPASIDRPIVGVCSSSAISSADKNSDTSTTLQQTAASREGQAWPKMKGPDACTRAAAAHRWSLAVEHGVAKPSRVRASSLSRRSVPAADRLCLAGGMVRELMTAAPSRALLPALLPASGASCWPVSFPCWCTQVPAHTRGDVRDAPATVALPVLSTINGIILQLYNSTWYY